MSWSKDSPASRGYGTAWRRVRERVLARDRYLCQCERCKAADRICVATEVDHIVSKAKWLELHGTLTDCDDAANLQAISHECHLLKTMLEKGHAPKTKFDANGFPTDPSHHWRKPND